MANTFYEETMQTANNFTMEDMNQLGLENEIEYNSYYRYTQTILYISNVLKKILFQLSKLRSKHFYKY